MTILERLISGPFLVTIIRYALVALGTWLVTNGYLSEEVWQQVLGGLMAVILALMGGAEATKDKAVSDGKTVPLEKLPDQAQAQIKQATTAPTKRRSLLDMLVGK